MMILLHSCEPGIKPRMTNDAVAIQMQSEWPQCMRELVSQQCDCLLQTFTAELNTVTSAEA